MTQTWTLAVSEASCWKVAALLEVLIEVEHYEEVTTRFQCRPIFIFVATSSDAYWVPYQRRRILRRVGLQLYKNKKFRKAGVFYMLW